MCSRTEQLSKDTDAQYIIGHVALGLHDGLEAFIGLAILVSIDQLLEMYRTLRSRL